VIMCVPFKLLDAAPKDQETTVVTLLLHCSYTVVTLLLHCCHCVVILLLHSMPH
jgi:hypothetical protein